MVKYLVTFDNIKDHVMDDGTTGFVMALARKDLELITILMTCIHPCDIDPLDLAKRALFELGKYSDAPDKETLLGVTRDTLHNGRLLWHPWLRQRLVDGLKQNIIKSRSVTKTSEKEAPQVSATVCLISQNPASHTAFQTLFLLRFRPALTLTLLQN